MVFAGFEVTMTLASATTDTVLIGDDIRWEIVVTSAASVYPRPTFDFDNGCGGYRDPLARNAELLVGGSVSGLVCIPVPAEYFDHPDTQVWLNLNGDRTAFVAGGATPPAVDLEPGGGPAAVGEPLAAGVPVEVTARTLQGDSTWIATVGPLRDLTEELVAQDVFSILDRGHRYVGFDVEMTLSPEAPEVSRALIEISWEILGGDSLSVYRTETTSVAPCGDFRDRWERTEVGPGGTVSGIVCFQVTERDLDHPDTRPSLDAGGRRYTFSPG